MDLTFSIDNYVVLVLSATIVCTPVALGDLSLVIPLLGIVLLPLSPLYLLLVLLPVLLLHL
jgi:hypothetical protein